MAGGQVTDILLAEPATRFESPRAINAHLTKVALVARFNAVLARQHRAALLALEALAVPDDVAGLAGTASPTYSQAQMQQVVDKLDEIATAQRAILAALREIAALPETHLEPLSNDQS